MDHVELSGVRVEFEVRGGGDPVVLVHARPFVTWFRPLVATLDDMSVLWYRRDTTGPSRTIEDDARLAEHTAEYLRGHDAEVEIVADGQAGLERACSGGHDIVLLDLMLPGIDGLALCKRLRTSTNSSAVQAGPAYSESAARTSALSA